MSGPSGATIEKVWSALADPNTYPHRPGSVEIRETHILWVFLAGEFAYKLKKPLVLDFLDYGTAERRREMRREEVRLNRRLAPDLYLGVQFPAASTESGRESAHAPDLITLAERFAWRARLPLAIVVCGTPATGKSYLARALSRNSGFAHLSSDLTRKRLVGLDPIERAGQEAYRADWNARTYSELGRCAACELGAGRGVIVDATFRHQADRQAFAAAVGPSGTVLFVECQAPRSVLAERAARRDAARAGVIRPGGTRSRACRRAPTLPPGTRKLG